ncbi:MAG: hypothetical protein ABFR97_09320 [Thermodesulfobacteriota bacterium]
MAAYEVNLRYFPGDLPDSLADWEIIAQAGEHNLAAEISQVENPQRKEVAGRVVEETLGVKFAKISQTIISLTGERQEDMDAFLHAFFRSYQSPRASFGLWGSNRAGEELARQIADFYD